MNKIIPFKKDIEFKTKISEITSISLEHNIKDISNDLISGEFIIEGEYKIIEGSINKESYKHVIPFDIAIGSNYDLSNVSVDIDNFYYDVKEDKILKVNIDLSVNNIEELMEVNVVKNIDKETIEELEEEIDEDRTIMDIDKLEEGIGVITPEVIEEELFEENNMMKEINNNIDIEIENENANINVNENNINLFENLKMEETYSTYRVYFVKENDNIDKILDKYKITKEELENYNDLSNIKVNDKLIIPTHE